MPRTGPRAKGDHRRALFVQAYLQTLNAAEACRMAGYRVTTARSAAAYGHKLLQHPEVAAAIQAAQKTRLASAELSATRVLEELRRLAFADIRGFFDESGNLKPPTDWTDEQAATLASVDVVKRNLTAGDGISDTVIKLKGWDKVRSLEMLAKHFALLVEKVEVTGEGAVVERLLAARKRVGK